MEEYKIKRRPNERRRVRLERARPRLILARFNHLTAAIFAGFEIDVMGPAKLAGIRALQAIMTAAHAAA